MGVNSKYKNSLFVWLFNDPDSLRELYSAIEGVPVDPALPLTINTLEDVFFMNQRNDISFEIGGKLVVLIEHQSTINPNMPLRMLMYIGRIYEKIIEDRNRYSETKLPLPQPEFIVLYNGEDPYPDVSTLRLSDAFENAAALGLIKGGLPALELIVTVYNINQGRNEAIARNCERLAGYSFFVGKAREFKKSGKSDKEAMKMALSYCIGHDILAEILRAHGSEVINMLLGEWKIDEAKEVWQREAEQRGRKEGEKRGEKRKALETAKNFLGMGLNPEQVAKGTGLDMETVKKLSVQ